MAPGTTIHAVDGEWSSMMDSTPTTGNIQLRPGFYVPTVAFFHPDTEDVDFETTRKHAIRLAEAGVTGLVTHGSNGEAVHLARNERQIINQISRDALDSVGRQDLPLIAGCSAQSVRETIQLCVEASESGASFALVLPPSYYAGLLDVTQITQYYKDVADRSPIPIIIYNYPGACSGLDLNSDAITEISKHSNVVGVKLTCGNTGKLARVRANASAPFLTMGGSADFTLQMTVVGGHGIIGGLANIFSKLCMRLLLLAQSGKIAEAQNIQSILANADWVAIKGGFTAVKVGLQHFYGYGGQPRRPCQLPPAADAKAMIAGFQEAWEMESRL